MAGAAPKTRSWTALENVHKPQGLHVIVSGLVEMASTRKQPRLAESPERNPKVLGLTLTIADTAGTGPDVKCWKEAFFHKEVKANQYDSVTIRLGSSSIAHFPVLDDREHQQKLVQLVKAANAAHPVKAAKKKPSVAGVASAAAATVVEAVGGLAKGAKKAFRSLTGSAKKKPAKTIAKKTAKKPAKKKASKAVGGWAKSKRKASRTFKKAVKKSGKKAKTARKAKKR